MHTLKERLGIALEKWIFAILNVLFPTPQGYQIMHPDWSNYNNHHGVDFRVFYYNKLILALECKNWRKINRKYDSQIALTEIADRFNHIGTNHKLCIMSFKNLLCSSGLKLIESKGIQLIETNKLIGHRDFKSQLFYTIKSAITKALKPRPNCSTSSNTISNYCSSSRSSIMTKPTIPTIEDSEYRAFIEWLDRPVRPLYVAWLRYKLDMEEGIK